MIRGTTGAVGPGIISATSCPPGSHLYSSPVGGSFCAVTDVPTCQSGQQLYRSPATGATFCTNNPPAGMQPWSAAQQASLTAMQEQQIGYDPKSNTYYVPTVSQKSNTSPSGSGPLVAPGSTPQMLGTGQTGNILTSGVGGISGTTLLVGGVVLAGLMFFLGKRK